MLTLIACNQSITSEREFSLNFSEISSMDFMSFIYFSMTSVRNVNSKIICHFYSVSFSSVMINIHKVHVLFKFPIICREIPSVK